MNILTMIRYMRTIIILALLLTGCVTSEQEPKTFEDLLFREDARNLAYKSVTIKDYGTEKDYNEK